MPIDVNQLEGWVGAACWAMARISGLLLVAPVLGATTIPVRIKMGLAILLTMTLAPLAPLAIHPLSAQGVATLAQQVLIGAALGFILKIVFEAVAFGGQFVSQAMSLGFAEVVNPGAGGTTPVLGQFYTMIVTLLFLVMNGHLQLISLLADSFRTMPVSDHGIGAEGIWGVLQFASHLFAGAVRVALPALTAVLVVNLGFGAISRSAPSMNLFAVGFPITICLGIIAVWLALRGLPSAWDSLQTDAWEAMRQMVGRSSP
jgi:flagellar biosynthetic protein FliR